MKPIEDRWSTEIAVNVAPHYKLVTLTSTPALAAGYLEAGSTFDALTPDQARDLAKRLTDAADEIEVRP